MVLPQITMLFKIIPERHHLEKENLYDRLLHICHYISLLTDGNALELCMKLSMEGRKIDNLTVVLIKSYLFLVKLLFNIHK
jgi:hypothetical protein